LKTHKLLKDSVRESVNYLLAQQADDFPEAVHYLNLPCMTISGDTEYQTHKTKLFQRMIILDSILDSAETFQENPVTKEIVLTETEKIIKSRHPMVEGGWSYIPELLLLPPDADDLGLVLQILARTGGKELASLCDPALDILFKYNRNSDGSFETWVTSPEETNGLNKKIKDYIKVIGGRGASPDVVANLLLGLKYYNSDKYKQYYRDAAEYLVKSQNANGYWESKWYWGNYYATWKVINIISGIPEYSLSAEKALGFLRITQNTDGGWGSNKSDPMNTAFALMCFNLTIAKNAADRNIILKALSYLMGTQATNGTWNRVPFIKMITEESILTYESKSITTAFCLKALLQCLKANEIPDLLEIDIDDFPFVRETGNMKIYSNAKWNWALINKNRLIQRSNENLHSDCNFEGYPGLHIIEVTKNCNLACSYCAANARRTIETDKHSDSNNQSIENITDFIVKNSGYSFCVEFQGGEPLLNFETIKSITESVISKSRMRDKTPYFRLVSNLLLINPETADFLKKYKFEVSTSLDGFPDLHNKNRKSFSRDNSYDKTIRGIELLKKYDIDPGIMAVITKDSLNYADEITDHFYSLGVYRFVLNPVTNTGRAGTNWASLAVDPYEYSLFWKNMVKRYFYYQKQGIPIWDRTLEHLVRKILNTENPGFVDLNSPCGCVSGQIAYDLEGNIFPCDEARFNHQIVLGNVSSHNWSSIRNSSLSDTLKKTSITETEYCGNCAYRPWCGRCPVKNFFSFGRFDISSEITDSCRLWKNTFDRFFELVIEEYGQLKKMKSLMKLPN